MNFLDTSDIDIKKQGILGDTKCEWTLIEITMHPVSYFSGDICLS